MKFITQWSHSEKIWQDIDETVVNLRMWFARGYERRSLKKGRWLKGSYALWRTQQSWAGLLSPCCCRPCSPERQEAQSAVGPVCLITVLTDMKRSRVFMPPALVAEEERTMLTFFFVKNCSLLVDLDWDFILRRELNRLLSWWRNMEKEKREQI